MFGQGTCGQKVVTDSSGWWHRPQVGLLIMLNFNSLSIVGRLSVRACQVRNFNLDGNFGFQRLIHGCATGDQTRWGARCFDGKENQVRAYACPSSFFVFYFFIFDLPSLFLSFLFPFFCRFCGNMLISG